MPGIQPGCGGDGPVGRTPDLHCGRHDFSVVPREVPVRAATEHGADLILPALTSVLRERLPERRPRFRLDRNVSLADALDRGLVDLAILLDGSGLDRANASGVVLLK